MKKSNDWKEGVAFVRGINIYRNGRITQKEMIKLCKKIETDDLKILKIVKTDNILFKKRNMHYASVGAKIEGVLSKHFGKQIYVTTRSLKTIKDLIEKFK